MVARAGFALVFFGLELGGIAWGQRAPDHALGFQMFNESSRLSIKLFREVKKKGKRVRVPLPDGTWRAPDRDGNLRHYAWTDRVKTRPLYSLGKSQHASYGLDAQLFRLQAALDDFVNHLPDDTTTLALIAEVEAVKNGKPAPLVTLRAEKP